MTPFHFVPHADEVLLNKASQAMKRYFPENLEATKLRGAVMDFISEIGLVPCPLVGGHGWMVKTLNAVGAQEVFKGMTMSMVHRRPGDNQDVKLSVFAFTFDHPAVFEPLLTAATESKGSVCVYADGKCSTDGNTPMQWAQLHQLSMAKGNVCKEH